MWRRALAGAMAFHVEPVPGVEGPLIVRTDVFEDPRGWFMETHRDDALRPYGIGPFVQDNESLSRGVGVLRGLHFQAPPHAQGKLVRCVRGAVLDAVVDLRQGSPTQEKWATFELRPDGRMLGVPAGFAHGFCTLTETTLVAYKVTAPYHAPSDGGVAWDGYGIPWPTDDPILSDKDRAAPPPADVGTPFRWEAS